MQTNTDELILEENLEIIDSIAVRYNNFINWYSENYQELAQYKLAYLDPNSDNCYRIDTLHAKKYLSILQSSGYFSQDFIQRMDMVFIRWDKQLKEEEIIDGPFLEADLFFYEVDIPTGDNYEDIKECDIYRKQKQNKTIYFHRYYSVSFILEEGEYKIDFIKFFNNFH